VLAGDVPTVRNPIQFSATPPRYHLAPPELDADGDAIRSWLGAQFVKADLTSTAVEPKE
jgi:crotonobetainyl-CoA:carnitine CoA-transferase CaiB-like acyl-CoA transferase